MEKIVVSMRGEALLNDPLLNKGTAFTEEERNVLGLHGLLPFHVSNIEDQSKRRYENFKKQPNPLAKYVFLSSMQNRNEILFYHLVSKHVTEMVPLIYTPTVGEASTAFSSIYTQHRGTYLSYPLKEKMEEIVSLIPRKDVKVIVVTDGERILGLGDLGANGMAISVGKNALYTLFGGIYPGHTLPILLDVGTNNENLLQDPLYLGWRHRRVQGKEYEDFVDSFVRAIKKRYPDVLLQWEDFAKPHARLLLERYRDTICSFNDDIQGTAGVALAAILIAVKVSRGALKDQRFCVVGAGSAGLGICDNILLALKEEGMSEKEAIDRFYLIDREGLLQERLTSMDTEQKRFAKSSQSLSSWKIANPAHITLLETIENIHPTILIGVSAQKGIFSEEITKSMAKYTPRPIIFPLSNPTDKSEADPKDLIAWTKGKAIIATGSPFPPVPFEGHQYPIAQCNNVYLFPGVGLGTIAARATKVTDRMFLKASYLLREFSPRLKDPQASLFPPLEELRSISREIAIAVALAAQEEGVAPRTSREEIAERVDATMWTPHYHKYA
jgi:malate dehydrogenase (oxaloacetate-decarboxylating)